MQIGVLGTNHSLLDLSLREEWIQSMRRVVRDLSFPYSVSYVLLLTCNRCEIYFSSSELFHTADLLKRSLQKELGASLETKSYTYFERECFSHLARVSSGLESAQIGETDIRRQVKQAYEKARLSSKLSSDLHFLFQKSLKIGKQFTNAIQGVEKEPSLEKLVAKMCTDLGGNQTLFFLGNSQINRKIIQRLSSKEGIEIWLCSRRKLSVSDPKIKYIDYSQMPLWENCDVVISASDETTYVISHPFSKMRTKLFIDLSVPRSIDPQIEISHGVPVINMDHLNCELEKSQLEFKDQINELKENVVCLVDKLMMRFEEKSAVCGAS